jgi:hypothetical protein
VRARLVQTAYAKRVSLSKIRSTLSIGGVCYWRSLYNNSTLLVLTRVDCPTIIALGDSGSEKTYLEPYSKHSWLTKAYATMFSTINSSVTAGEALWEGLCALLVLWMLLRISMLIFKWVSDVIGLLGGAFTTALIVYFAARSRDILILVLLILAIMKSSTQLAVLALFAWATMYVVIHNA